MTIASPCTGACVVDQVAAACSVCGRSLAQIAGWLGMSNAERLVIMATLAARRNATAVGDNAGNTESAPHEQ